VFDEHGNVLDVRGRSQTESHRLIEHLMIAANEAVARLLEQRGAPCLFRVHENPDPQRVEQLVEQLASLDVPTPPVREGSSPTQAAELVGEISRLVDAHVRRTGRGRVALSSLVLRSLKQAYYSPRNIGHAGLRSPSYCHFTSPIRRYPDLVCHRALLSAVGGWEQAPRADELGELGAWTSEREREAALVERDADDVVRCFLLERVARAAGPDAVYGGEITGMIAAGVFIAFGDDDGAAGAAGERPFEGMLPVRMLGAGAPANAAAQAARGRTPAGERRGAAEQPQPREWWQLNELGTILHGERSGATLRLGDPIAVRVGRIDTARGRVDLLPAG
jgi:ribonuclease R